MKGWAILAFCLIASPARTAFADWPLPTLYSLHCSGCHGEDGKGAPSRGIPDLHNIGYYVTVPLGRRYLIEVPGLSQSTLTDAQAAQMLNYVLQRFSGAALPRQFPKYTAGEVAKYRSNIASDAPIRRQAILAQLQGAVSRDGLSATRPNP